DEDFDEPEIPEDLIAEQRRGQQGGRGGQQGNRGGPRGGRAAYTAAIDRERYGRGGGGGINRYPDVSGGREVSERERQIQGGGRSAAGGGGQRQSGAGGRPDTSYARQDASYSRGGGGDRVDRQPAPRSGDPWSEVPPELEEMLRAQLAQSPKARPAAPTTSRIEAAGAAGDIETMTELPVEDTAPEAPKRRAPTRRKPADAKAETLAADGAAPSAGGGEPAATGAGAPKRRTTRKTPAALGGPALGDAAPDSAAMAVDAPEAGAPKRRAATRKKADADVAAGSSDAGVASVDDAPAAPKRRVTRKKAEPA
ncbi:MAG: hypothetical protein QOF49_1570, partial [Chloroflexota bacterium]|nr:hypothetical protein [Chloroflexota bacterium]